MTKTCQSTVVEFGKQQHEILGKIHILMYLRVKGLP